MPIAFIRHCSLALCAAAIATPALAQSNPGPVPPAPLTERELADTRGGQTIVVNSQVLSAVTGGTLNGNYTAGSITLSDNALSNFNGIGNFVLNTGAQNSLQSGMTLTVITN